MEERLFKINKPFKPTCVMQLIKQPDGMEIIRLHEHKRYGNWFSLELKEPCTPEFNDEMLEDNRRQGCNVKEIDRDTIVSLRWHLDDLDSNES